MKLIAFLFFLILPCFTMGQAFDTSRYSIIVEVSTKTDSFFMRNPVWRGADGAASIDLENGKVLWLFGDGFINGKGLGTRKNAGMIRNSIAIQNGYSVDSTTLRYFWNDTAKEAKAFFQIPGNFWFWTGHGIMIKDKLLIFLMKIKDVKTGLGFEVAGWNAVLISNPHESPTAWMMKYIEGTETYGTIAGSAAVLKDEQFLYAYGAVEPGTHEVYLLRWKLEEAYKGNLANAAWWINGSWSIRKSIDPIPPPLFIGATEYSVHYDQKLGKYIQVQSYGFGEAKIGIRMADKMEGPWTEPFMVYAPVFPGIKKPFMYAAKAHPELKSTGTYITYNVNSFDFSEVLDNQSIYFPRFIRINIRDKAKE